MVRCGPISRSDGVEDRSLGQHRHAFEALSSGRYDNFALFSCFIDGSPGAAIVAVDSCPPAEEGAEPECTVRPLFVSVTPAMTIADHDGREA